MSKLQLRIVEVTWLDISSHLGWYHIEDAEGLQPLPITSVGYYLGEGNGVLNIATDCGYGYREGEVQDVLSLPMGCIISITPLRKR